MPRPRVLINALSLTYGGGRSYVVNLLRELGRDARGFDVTVLTAAGQLSAEETSGVRVQTLQLPSPRFASRVAFRVLYEEALLPLHATRYDLLYCLADLSPAVGLVPTVVALRNLNIYDRRFYDTRRLRVLERLVRLGLRRAERVVFPSRAAADLITKRIPLPPERIAVIPHGVARDAFAEGDAPSAADVPPYLFLPAALERHKNIPVLLECLAHVKDPRLQVWVAGGADLDPACEAALRRIVQSLRVESRVRFLGRVPYREILGLYRGAVALVFPSLIETFGHPLLEAMVAGTPIVAADIPSFREIAGDTALYFPARDPVRLAQVIDQMRREPQATRVRVERGFRRAQEFSWSRSVDRLCEVFNEALGSARARPTVQRPSATDETGEPAVTEPPLRVVHFQRRPKADYYSMERLFADVRRASPPDVAIEARESRYESTGLWRRLHAVLEAARHQGDVNHVTGDVHFLACLMQRRRTVLTVHDCVTLERLTGLAYWAHWFFWYWWPSRRSHVITVISESTRRELLRHLRFDPARIRVIHDCVSDSFRADPRGFDASRPRILIMGTSANKNVERMVAALRCIPCRLTIVGRLSESQRAALADSGLEYESRTGLSDEELVQQYRDADLLLYASTYEGFGLPIVEAQAVGRPVVTSNLYSMPEVAGDAACLVDPSDVESIRGGVLRVIRDASYREQLVAEGFRNVERFRPGVIAAQYAQLYREIGRASES